MTSRKTSSCRVPEIWGTGDGEPRMVRAGEFKITAAASSAFSASSAGGNGLSVQSRVVGGMFTSAAAASSASPALRNGGSGQMKLARHLSAFGRASVDAEAACTDGSRLRRWFAILRLVRRVRRRGDMRQLARVAANAFTCLFPKQSVGTRLVGSAAERVAGLGMRWQISHKKM